MTNRVLAALAVAAGATALGAVAVGFFAIGQLGVGRLALGRGTVDSLHVREFRVDRLIVSEQTSSAAGGPEVGEP